MPNAAATVRRMGDAELADLALAFAAHLETSVSIDISGKAVVPPPALPAVLRELVRRFKERKDGEA